MTALEKLEALGSTPDAVAESLREMGIRGRQGDIQACPLARYLGPGYYVGANSFWRVLGVSRPLPQACSRFRERFDARRYPDLLL